MATTCDRCVVHRPGANALSPHEFFDPVTGGTLTTGTFRFFPAHRRTRTISEGDRIVAVAADLLEALKGKEPETAAQRRQHVKILKHLTKILHKPTQGGRELRVNRVRTIGRHVIHIIKPYISNNPAQHQTNSSTQDKTQ